MLFFYVLHIFILPKKKVKVVKVFGACWIGKKFNVEFAESGKPLKLSTELLAWQQTGLLLVLFMLVFLLRLV